MSLENVAWKMGDRWVIVTHRSPREMKKEPMAVYFPREGPTRFQYALDRRPRASENVGLSFLRDE